MNRSLITLAMLMTSAAATAQTTVPLAPAAASALSAAAPNLKDLAPLPLLATRQAIRPADQLPGARFEGELSAANARALADLNQFRITGLRPLGDKVSPPANCDRRVLKVGLSGSSFTLRPGQSVAIGGCFGDAPAGEVRLNGSFPGGHVRLQVVEWTPTHVHARVPDLTGVFDMDNVRLQLKFGDGDFSNEFTGSFRARRAAYAAEGNVVRMHTDFLPLNSGQTCNWEDLCPLPAPLKGQETHSIAISRVSPSLGSYALKMRNPQFHIMGVYASVFAGQLQFSNWGASGELVLDWGTAMLAPVPTQRSLVRIDKIVFDAPVGTAIGASLQTAAFQPIAGLPR